MARRKKRSTDSPSHRSTLRRGSGQADDLVRLADAARRAGITVNQLQYYLYVSVVQPTRPRKVGDGGKPGTQRLFDSKAIQRIRMVKLLNDSGYPLREIREIFMERKKKANRQGAKSAKRRGFRN